MNEDQPAEIESLDIRKPPFPVVARVAGAIWCAFGVLFLISMAINLLLFFVLTTAFAEATGRSSALTTVTACGGICLSGIGAAFILVGVQTIIGAARGTMENGIGSLIFGLIYLGFSGTLISNSQILAGVFAILLGAGLIAGGILAIIARNDYKAWRQARRAGK